MKLNTLYKTENIITIKPEDTLSHALSLLSSSHDSAFVVDDKKEFLGVVNPYYCLIKKSYPANTKIKHCLFHPPKIDINDPVKKVVRVMLESKVHYLPVFSQNAFYGIISARRILASIQDSPELKIPIEKVLKHKQPLVTVDEKDYLSKALSLFKKYHFSKLIVISKDLKLKGVLAYYDLISSLVSPKKNQHNNASLLKQYIKNYMKTIVLTVSPKDSLSKAAHLILEKQIGSVLVVDDEKHPIGLITTKDLLSLITGKPERQKIEVMTRDLSRQSAHLVREFVSFLTRRMTKVGSTHARVIVKEKKDRGVFETIVSIFDRKKHVTMIKKEGKNLKKILEQVKDKTKEGTAK
jgi:acetoin utilization protein AcuB